MKEKLEKVLNKVWAGLKVIGKEIYFFISSQIFLKNFAGMVAFIALLLLITFWWMNCFTRHGESLQIHDYTNMQLADALEKARSRNLEVVVNDSIWRKGVDANIILSQNPEPFQSVKKNRKVYITVSKGSELETIPDVAGNDDFQNYKNQLKRIDVEAEILSRKFNSRLEENTILEVIYEDETLTEKQLAKGFKVKKGSTVYFIVTKKTDSSVQVPELVCKQFDAASFLVNSSNLNIGSVIPDATVNNESTAYVWKQIPRYSPSGRMRVGDQIEIYLTQYKPRHCGGENTIESGFSDDTDNSGENEEF